MNNLTEKETNVWLSEVGGGERSNWIKAIKRYKKQCKA